MTLRGLLILMLASFAGSAVLLRADAIGVPCDSVEAVRHHVHAHSHDGHHHAHGHAHGHSDAAAQTVEDAKAALPSFEPGDSSDDDHHCCDMCSGHGPNEPAARVAPDRLRQDIPSAFAIATDVEGLRPKRAANRPPIRPPPRAGPPDHLPHLRTVVLLT